MEIRELRAFVAVVEEGGLSAAARRLHLSQSALSQSMQSLERQLGVAVLVRDHAGARATDAGQVLLREARELIAHHDRSVAVLNAATGSLPGTAGLLRIGLPLEFPQNVLLTALARLRADYPDTRVEARHSSSAAQLEDLIQGRLELALVRDRPADPALDAVLAVQESMGVLLSAASSDALAGPDGVQLQRLGALQWMGFPRTDTPAWHDQIVAILRGHGIIVDERGTDPRAVIAEVKLAAVGAGEVFALAPPGWGQPLPNGIGWHPLIADPLIRRTWAVWRADARERDLAALVDALDRSDN